MPPTIDRVSFGLWLNVASAGNFSLASGNTELIATMNLIHSLNSNREHGSVSQITPFEGVRANQRSVFCTRFERYFCYYRVLGVLSVVGISPPFCFLNVVSRCLDSSERSDLCATTRLFRCFFQRTVRIQSFVMKA